jgi:hypothetical protein
MQMRKWLHRHIAWLALCAVFFGAIAPSISHLLVSANGKTWVEICSVYGSKRMALDLGSQKAPNVPSSMAHCPFCLLQNDLPVIPTSLSLAAFAVMLDEAALEGLAAHPPRARFIRTAHLTRAPPSIS